eukprot:TRINITY_DN6186_c2_g1_i1.p1 TRINITY_DN6186_c2_g1~~TRINITY_DN6186_c2_g1_i1.p1  ORF type:complete len:812 (+),score=221.98 TRINITY_DN6186_c2_g1_i1:56-2491(+)
MSKHQELSNLVTEALYEHQDTVNELQDCKSELRNAWSRTKELEEECSYKDNRIRELQNQLEKSEEEKNGLQQKIAGEFDQSIDLLKLNVGLLRIKLVESLRQKDSKRIKRRKSFSGSIEESQKEVDNELSLEEEQFIESIPSLKYLKAAMQEGFDDIIDDAILPEVSTRFDFEDSLTKVLFQICEFGYTEHLQRLLQFDINLDVIDDSGRTLIHVAAGCSKEDRQFHSAQVLRLLLLTKTIDADRYDRQQCTAFHHACMYNNQHAIKVLMRNGVDVDKLDRNGEKAIDMITDDESLSILQDQHLHFWNSSVRANNLYHEKRFDLASEAYGKALGLVEYCTPRPSDRDMATLYYNRARSQYQINHIASALEDCNEALKKCPFFVKTLQHRAECRLRLMDFVGAKKDFEDVLKSQPDNETVRQNIKHAERMNMLRHYIVLGINVDASSKVIKKAYHNMCLKYHPDKCVDKEMEMASKFVFPKISEAYSVLLDPLERQKFDLEVVNEPSSPSFNSHDFHTPANDFDSNPTWSEPSWDSFNDDILNMNLNSFGNDSQYKDDSRYNNNNHSDDHIRQPRPSHSSHQNTPSQSRRNSYSQQFQNEQNHQQQYQREEGEIHQQYGSAYNNNETHHNRSTSAGTSSHKHNEHGPFKRQSSFSSVHSASGNSTSNNSNIPSSNIKSRFPSSPFIPSSNGSYTAESTSYDPFSSSHHSNFQSSNFPESRSTFTNPNSNTPIRKNSVDSSGFNPNIASSGRNMSPKKQSRFDFEPHPQQSTNNNTNNANNINIPNSTRKAAVDRGCKHCGSRSHASNECGVF